MTTTVKDCTTFRIEDIELSLKDKLRQTGWYEKITRRLDDTEEVLLPWEFPLPDGPTDARHTRTEQRIRVSATSLNFGGAKLWFRCPGRGLVRDCDGRVGTLYRPSVDQKFFCRSCWNLSYECRQRTGPEQDLTEVFSREAEAVESLHSCVPTREELRAVYDVRRRAHDVRLDVWYSDESAPAVNRTFPSFDEWVEVLTEEFKGQLRGRPYGPYGRCAAEAKTHGKRCRQPAVDDHGKCYYHGGAE